MKKWLFLLGMIFVLTGCKNEQDHTLRAEAGTIGADMPISREMAAKTIALAFYTNDELEKMETELDFSDISVSDWSYPYIKGCVEEGFFVGSEEGIFRPKEEVTLWEAQALIFIMAPADRI